MPFSSADPQCACRRYAAARGTAGPLSLREVSTKETHKAAVGYREAADDPARRRQAWPPATASGRGPHFRRARNPSGAGPRGGSPGQGPAPEPAREAEGGGPTGTGRAGPGSGDPLRHDLRCLPGPPRPPATVTAPRPRAPQSPASPHKANPLPSRAAPHRAAPRAHSPEARPPLSRSLPHQMTNVVRRPPLGRSLPGSQDFRSRGRGRCCACARRGRGSAPSPFCCGPRGRVSRGLAASRLLSNV